jgi:hypothetical protein
LSQSYGADKDRLPKEIQQIALGQESVGTHRAVKHKNGDKSINDEIGDAPP